MLSNKQIKRYSKLIKNNNKIHKEKCKNIIKNLNLPDNIKKSLNKRISNIFHNK